MCVERSTPREKRSPDLLRRNHGNQSDAGLIVGLLFGINPGMRSRQEKQNGDVEMKDLGAKRRNLDYLS